MNFIEFWQDNKNAILSLSIFLNILLLGLSLYLFFTGSNKKCPACNCEQNKTISMNTANDQKEVNECQVEEKKFYVEIKGEVNFPGVYEADKDNIINDIIDEAGGFTKDAYTDNINLSRKVSDELVIYVYDKNEISDYLNNEDDPKINEPCLSSSYDISNCTDDKKSEIVADHPEETYTKDTWENEDSKNVFSEDDGVVDINTASKEELMSIDYIGEAKAKAIIAYRESEGLFKNIEDIKNVKGIGEALFAKIKNHIKV